MIFMREKIVVSTLVILLLSILTSTPISMGDISTIVVDGDFSDWDGISPLVIDPTGDGGNLDISAAYVTMDDTFLYLRVDYAEPYDVPILWSNTTLRVFGVNYLIMAWAMEDWCDVSLWYAESLTDDCFALDFIDSWMDYSAASEDMTRIEFKVPLPSLGAPDEVDLVFWSERAAYGTYDRAPDEGYVTYTGELGVPTIYDAIEDIEKQIEHRGTANSLTSKLENALHALEESRMDAFENILNAFINSVEAQSGKKIDEDYADTLIRWAQTWIEDPGSAPEITIELECILPYRIYRIEDPTLIAYQIYNRVNVYSEDGSTDVSTVEMITPDGDIYAMTLDQTHEYNSIYTHRLDLPAPILGTWRFIAVDGDGNTAETSFDVPWWIDVVPVSVTPAYEQSIPYGTPLEWDITWGPDAPEFEHYEVTLFLDSGEWCAWAYSMPFTYSGPQLSEGFYDFQIYAVMSIPGVMGGEVQIVGRIYVEPQA